MRVPPFKGEADAPFSQLSDVEVEVEDNFYISSSEEDSAVKTTNSRPFVTATQARLGQIRRATLPVLQSQTGFGLMLRRKFLMRLTRDVSIGFLNKFKATSILA
jgi:hypothetical protein